MKKTPSTGFMKYTGPTYNVIVDGQVVASFNTLTKLSFRQTLMAKNAYALRLRIPPHRMEVEAVKDNWQHISEPVQRVVESVREKME